jgi:CheY-like chemotaxis protein
MEPRRLFLIADDIPGKTFFLSTIVRRSGVPAEIITARSTAEAKEVIAAHPQEIVAAFIDYRMPSEGGPTVIETLRKSSPSAKIALVTASDIAAFEEEARIAGADAYISTAYPEREVVEKLHRLLREWQAVPAV